jgi:teichuronic acid biosynthesis glycosyltransferase TuaG
MIYNKTVSVIIACYNAERFIGQCLTSILNQSYEDIEVIIVDDASTDASLQIITNFSECDHRVFFVPNKRNVGAAEARNIGISHACGRYIAICDADDFWENDKLACQIPLFKGNVGVVSSDIKLIQSDGRVLKTRRYPKVINHCYQKFLPFPAHSSIVIDKSKLTSILHYDPKFTPAEDYNLLLSLSYECEIVNLRIPKVYYRMHDKNISNKKYTTLGQVGLSIIANLLREREVNSQLLNSDFDCLTFLTRKNRFEERYNEYVIFKNDLKRFKLNNPSIENIVNLLWYIIFRKEPRKRYAEILGAQESKND